MPCNILFLMLHGIFYVFFNLLLFSPSNVLQFPPAFQPQRLPARPSDNVHTGKAGKMQSVLPVPLPVSRSFFLLPDKEPSPKQRMLRYVRTGKNNLSVSLSIARFLSSHQRDGFFVPAALKSRCRSPGQPATPPLKSLLTFWFLVKSAGRYKVKSTQSLRPPAW